MFFKWTLVVWKCEKPVKNASNIHREENNLNFIGNRWKLLSRCCQLHVICEELFLHPKRRIIFFSFHHIDSNKVSPSHGIYNNLRCTLQGESDKWAEAGRSTRNFSGFSSPRSMWSEYKVFGPSMAEHEKKINYLTGNQVYISNIPSQLTECDIMPIVRCFGDVFQLRLMMKINGENRGFCYVMYMREEYARNAIKRWVKMIRKTPSNSQQKPHFPTRLNKSMFWGQQLIASISKNRKQLILGNINPTIPDFVIIQAVKSSISPKNVSFPEFLKTKSLENINWMLREVSQKIQK